MGRLVATVLLAAAAVMLLLAAVATAATRNNEARHPQQHPEYASGDEHRHAHQGLAHVEALTPGEWAVLCPVCEAAVPPVLAELDANSTDGEVATALDKVCAAVSGANATRLAQCQLRVRNLILLMATKGHFMAAKFSTNGLCAILGMCLVDCCQSPTTPEQIHVAATGDATQMRVAWTTLTATQSVAQVSLAPDPDNYQVTWAPSNVTEFQGGLAPSFAGIGGFRGFVHDVLLTGLQPDTEYVYRVGDPTAQAMWFPAAWDVPLLSFRTPPPAGQIGSGGPDAPLRVAVFADMGASDVSDPVLSRLDVLRLDGALDLVLHAGDIAYADGFETLNDQFLRKVEPIAARLPYMVAPGNHENFADFASYISRWGSVLPWQESGSASPLYYSFDYGALHVTAWNSEAPMEQISDIRVGSPQYKWIENDLANAAANPDIQWIIAMAHRPVYCSAVSLACDAQAAYIAQNLEPLFDRYHVDIVTYGHVHAYERTYPVLRNQTVATDYHNPAAPVYLMSGAGGCQERTDRIWVDPAPEWSAARLGVYGFGYLEILNSTALHWSFVSGTTGAVLDQFDLTRSAPRH